MGSVVWINHEQGETEMLDTLIALTTVIGFAVLAFYVRRRMDNRSKIRNWPLEIPPFTDPIVCGPVRPGPRGDKLSKQERLKRRQYIQALRSELKARQKALNPIVEA